METGVSRWGMVLDAVFTLHEPCHMHLACGGGYRDNGERVSVSFRFVSFHIGVVKTGWQLVAEGK